jgi:hypothetical protein
MFSASKAATSDFLKIVQGVYWISTRNHEMTPDSPLLALLVLLARSRIYGRADTGDQRSKLLQLWVGRCVGVLLGSILLALLHQLDGFSYLILLGVIIVLVVIILSSEISGDGSLSLGDGISVLADSSTRLYSNNVRSFPVAVAVSSHSLTS